MRFNINRIQFPLSNRVIVSWLILTLLIFGHHLNAQQIDEIPVNEAELNTPVTAYSSDIELITGNEDIYFEYEWLRNSVLKNIANGIREGVYVGSKHNIINDIKASKTTFFFYRDKLYKIRWFYKKSDYVGINDIANKLDDFLIARFGKTNDKGFLTSKVWRGREKYLQSFLEEGEEYQIEYRDMIIHETVRQL